MRKSIQIVCALLGCLLISCSTSGRISANKIYVIIPPKDGESTDAYLIGEKPQLMYPKKAFVQRREGFVHLQFTVGTNGKAKNIHIIKEEPEGFGFALSAIKSVRDLSFRPAVLNGVFVNQNMVRKYNFKL